LARLATLPPRPQLIFVSVAADDTFHHVRVAALDRLSQGAFTTPLTCQRVYFSANRGICLSSAAGPDGRTAWRADVFNERFETLHTLPLTGEPSRVRVSPDAHFAGATVFESGHSYAGSAFSTRTSVVDLTTGTTLGDLEQWETRRNGQPCKAVDFNFWGLTFAADGDTFYATLDTAGISYLVRGSVRARAMEVVREGVECPSLSPDGRRIAFKKRVGARSRGWWQIAVVHLETGQETIVSSESRSVDDQVEWLDDQRVVYHLSSGSTAADLWAVRVDNSAPPERMLTSAYSPAVVR
jgi:hypothetical protein